MPDQHDSGADPPHTPPKLLWARFCLWRMRRHLDNTDLWERRYFAAMGWRDPTQIAAVHRTPE